MNNERMRKRLIIPGLLIAMAAGALACQVYTEDLLLPALTAGAGGTSSAAGGGLPARVLWSTSFEPGEPAFHLAAGPGEVTGAPADIEPRTGEAALSTTIITPDFDFLTIRSACLPINIADTITARAWGSASPTNGGNSIWLRIAVLWHDDPGCTPPGAVLLSNSAQLPAGAWLQATAAAEPPPATAAYRLRLDVRDEPGDWPGESWAVDDVTVTH